MKPGIALSVFIGQRLSLRRDSGQASAGVFIAVTGIAIAFVVMLLSIAIVQGFRNEIISKLTGFNSQITLTAAFAENDSGEPATVRLTDSLRNEILSITGPESRVSFAITQPAVFKTDSAFQGVVLRGMPKDADWDFVGENLVEGQLPDFNAGGQQTVISASMAQALGVKAGDKLPTHFFEGNSLRSRNLLVTGVYNTHLSDFDGLIAFTPASLIQQLARLDSLTGTVITINGLPYTGLAEDTRRLYDNLMNSAIDHAAATGEQPHILRAESVKESCAMYVSWLDLLDTNVAVIITLMTLVSGFTLISSLFIIILERVNMIGLLKALGATNGQIRKIFIYMAQRLVVRGLIIGNILGIGFLLIQNHWHIIPLNPEAYYLNYVPVNISVAAIVILNIAVIVAAALILILPSHLISSLSPTKSMKFE